VIRCSKFTVSQPIYQYEIENNFFKRFQGYLSGVIAKKYGMNSLVC